jgi:transcription antitermination factor NusG
MPNKERIWYDLATRPGYEKKVKRGLEHRKLTLDAEDCIFRIEIPPTIRGYVLVETLPGERAWHIARNTPGVQGIEKVDLS